jgi:hypothetical protein
MGGFFRDLDGVSTCGWVSVPENLDRASGIAVLGSTGQYGALSLAFQRPPSFSAPMPLSQVEA